jgi:hypothetical protein
MFNFPGLEIEVIDEENIRLKFLDGSSILMTIKEEEMSPPPQKTRDILTIARLCHIYIMKCFEQEDESMPVPIDEKPEIH